MLACSEETAILLDAHLLANAHPVELRSGHANDLNKLLLAEVHLQLGHVGSRRQLPARVIPHELAVVKEFSTHPHLAARCHCAVVEGTSPRPCQRCGSRLVQHGASRSGRVGSGTVGRSGRRRGVARERALVRCQAPAKGGAVGRRVGGNRTKRRMLRGSRLVRDGRWMHRAGLGRAW